MTWNELVNNLLMVDPPEGAELRSVHVNSLSAFWWLFLTSFVIVVGSYVLFLRFLERNHLTGARRFVSIGLMVLFRTLALTLILLLLARISLVLEFVGERPRPLAILLDHSQSMTQADRRLSDEDKLRVALALDRVPIDTPLAKPSITLPTNIPERPDRVTLLKGVLRNKQLKLMERLGQKAPLRIYTFGSQLRTLHDDTASGSSKKEAAGKLNTILGEELIALYQKNHRPSANKQQSPSASEEKNQSPSASEEKQQTAPPQLAFDSKTALWDVVHGLLDRKDGGCPAGIVIMTDGRDNASKLAMHEAAARCGELRIPLYIYGVGSSEGGSLQLKHLAAPETIFYDDRVVVTVRGRAQGFKKGSKVRVRVTMGGKPVASRVLAVPPQGDFESEMSFEWKKEGEKKSDKQELAASVEIVGKEQEFADKVARPVRVVDAKVKVLYIETAPRWEYKYLQQAYLMRDRRVEARFLVIQADPQVLKPPPSLKNPEDWPYLAEFPAREKLFTYDVVILGDVSAAWLGQERMTWLRDFVFEGGGGLIHIAGQQHGPASYVNTPLAEILPVEFDTVTFPAPGVAVATGGRQRRGQASSATEKMPYVPILTEEGERSEMLALADTPEQSLEIWKTLPALPLVREQAVSGGRNSPDALKIPTAQAKKLSEDDWGFYWHYPVKGLRAGATALFVHPTARTFRAGAPAREEKPMPLMARQFYGKGLVLFMATDETWRWRANHRDRHVARLWGQIIYEMGMPHVLGGGRRVQVSLQGGSEVIRDRHGYLHVTVLDKQYRPFVERGSEGQIKPLRAKLKIPAADPTSGDQQPASEEDVTLEPVPGQPGRYRLLLTHTHAGRHRLELSYPENLTYEYVVGLAPGHEMEVGGMAEEELRKAAELSGRPEAKYPGKFYREEDLHRLVDDVQARKAPFTLLQPMELLSHRPLIFILIVTLLTGDWLVRKFINLS